jgi:endonuclease G
MEYFTVKRLREFRDAAMAAGLGAPTKRDLLLAGIHGAITGRLKIYGSSSDQIYGDLLELNGIERLVDGTVPISIWLENAEAESKPRPQAATFEAARKEVTAQTDMRPAIVPPPVLEEKNEIVIHQDDMLPLWFLMSGYEAAKSVAKLLVPRYDSGAPAATGSGEAVVGSGTVWLLTPDLLITNHHVINARHDKEGAASPADLIQQVEHSVAQFDFDADGVEGQKTPVIRLEASDPGLDYAILRAKESTGRKGLRIAPERLEKRLEDYVPVNIIQHPNARYKKIAIRNNLVTSSAGDDLRYFTDTDFGSSGSPVFDDQWRVVALHRGAAKVSNVQFQGRTTAWVNYGSHIRAIFDHIKSQHEPLWREIGAG